MDPFTLWVAIRLRYNTERLMRQYAVRRWWPAPLSESELRLMDGNR